ncbi:MAG TPA: hypothetical protein VNT79_00220 [Phycisphaerae bacterium]|nr:hypothetical protein [Phycisphaerae bacterium]
MKASVKIGLRYTFTGFLKCAIAVAVVAFALHNYAGPVHWLAHSIAAGTTVFLLMNRSMWRAIHGAHEAGEVDRRVVAQIDHVEEEQADDGAKSTWFDRENGRPRITSSGVARGQEHRRPTVASA